MDVTSMPTEEIDRVLSELLHGELYDGVDDDVRSILTELRRREPQQRPSDADIERLLPSYLRHLPTMELLEAYHEELQNMGGSLLTCRNMGIELSRRRGEATMPELREAWEVYDQLFEQPDGMIDPATGLELTPSWHGEECSGARHGACDECDHYMACWPDDEHPDTI